MKTERDRYLEHVIAEGWKRKQETLRELKHKKEVPTVIEYCGRRYVLDDRNHK